MKRSIAIVLGLCLLLAGCSPAANTPAAPDIHDEPICCSIYHEDGTQLIALSYPHWEITLADQSIAQRIQEDLDANVRRWFFPAIDLEEYARDAYTGQESWTLWSAKLDGSVKRCDDRYLSIFLTYEEFTGSAHPSYTTHSVTYDCQTGQKVELHELMADGLSVNALIPVLQKQLAPLAQQLFDDYEALAAELMSNEPIRCWYLSSTGLCFHFAPYQLGPYSAGIIQLEIPYAQLEGILELP